MKRYETMSKEEIVDFFSNCMRGNCENCAGVERPLEGTTPRSNCAIGYLNEEVVMVPRFQTIQNKQQLLDPVPLCHRH